MDTAVMKHSDPANSPEPVGPTNPTDLSLRLGTTLVLGEQVKEVESPPDVPKTELASQQVAESQIKAVPAESGNGSEEVESKPNTEKETKEGTEIATKNLEEESPKVEQAHVPEPKVPDVEVKEGEPKKLEVKEPPKPPVNTVKRQDQENFKNVVKATRSKRTGNTQKGDKDHDSAGEEPPKKMKRPAAAPKRNAKSGKDAQPAEEVESPIKPRNLAAELEAQKDEHETPDPEADKQKPKKRGRVPAKAKADCAPPVKAARKSKVQPKVEPPVDKTDATAKDAVGNMPAEIQALMGSKTTFAGRRCPKTKDAASRFAVMVTTYKTKIEPLVDSTSFLQVGV